MTATAFIPRRGLSNGHVMTIFAWGRRRHHAELPTPVERVFDVAPDERVMGHCHWQRDPRQHPTVLLLHGLEGSSSAHYMVGMADKAWRRGCNVVRLNQRNCGGTERLSRGLYHSGLCADPAAVVNELASRDGLPAIAVIGYSLGGNLTLRLAGEYGRSRLPALAAAVAVSPTLDLALCVRALERRQNFIYQWNFVRNLKSRMRRKAHMFPEVFDVSRIDDVDSVRTFDEMFTAPHHGFRDADDYYHRASALRVIDRIDAPTLILSAADDPFVPPSQFADPLVAGNRAITVEVTPHGGHCAFVAPAQNRFDGYWAEQRAIDFVLRAMPASPAPVVDEDRRPARALEPAAR